MDVRQYAFLARQPSACVKTREHFWGMPKRGLAFLLANVMFWQPMWAQAEGIVVATPGTSLGQAGNGVPIVNIAMPNGTGLSHNQFHDYNVGTQGVILNNVANQTGATQLGGIIVGNPNLTNRVAAQTILNEVVGGSPSQLRGYTEVAGQSARVIVANPYGISCNGCGFINTPRVTLTTGKPVLDNGRLDRFQVDQGSVSIDGAGLNANNVDSFEIITRSAKINAEIQAKNLTIVAGRNDVNAQSLNATARADDGSAKPQLAIDSSALGGMYAGAIKLVGTEAGVGVKLAGNLAASGGDIQLDANGHLSLAQTSAAGAVNVKAASLDARGPVYAGAVNVQTQGNLTNQQTLAARDGIVLSAGGQLTNNGIIEAGVNADNSRNANGDVSLTAQNLNNSGKSVVASRNLTVSAAQTLNNQGGTLSGQTTNITTAVLDNQNNGRVLSNSTLNLHANKVFNAKGVITSTGNLYGNFGRLNNNSGELSSLADIVLNVVSLDNVAGLVTAGQALSLTVAGAVNNHDGKLTSLDSLTLTAGSVDNSGKGRIASNKSLTASVSSLDQQDGGQLTSDTSLILDLNHGTLNNKGGLINAPSLVLKNLAQVDNRSGEISSAQAFTFAADSLDNSNGKLLGNQAITLRVTQALTNVKGTIASAQLDAQVGSLNNNSGTLTSRSDLVLRVNGQLDNQDKGLINAAQNLNINAANLNNQNGGSLLGSAIAIDFSGAMGDLNNAKGLITTAGQLSINNLRDLNNQGGELSSNLSYTLRGRNLDNSDGMLFSRQQLDLNAASTRNLNGLISGWGGLSLLGGSLDNRNKGTLSSRDGDLLVDLTGDVLNRNAGALVSKGTLKVTTASLDNSEKGILSSEGAQTFIVAGTLNNGLGGLIDSGAGLEIQAKALSNINGFIYGKQDLRITGTDLNNSEGVLSGDTSMTLDLLGTLTNTKGQLVSVGPLVISQAAQINNQGGKLVSQGLLTLLTGDLDNRNGGTVAANDALTVTASGVVQNSADGLIYSADADLTVNAASLDNAKGNLQSEGDLTVKTDGAIDNQSGRIVAKSGNLKITADSLDSRGGVLASLKGAFSARITGVLRNGYDLNNNRQDGVIQAQRLDLKAWGGLENNGGRITAQTGDVIIDTGASASFDNRNGGLYAKERVSVTAKDFDNSGDLGGQIAGQQIDLSLRGALNNRKGIIESISTLSITAASIDNQTGQLRALGNAGKTVFAIGGVFDNRNGTVESANSNLDLGAGGLLNTGGNVLHVGTGVFDIATSLLGSAGGSFVTRGGLTVAADSWTNSSVIQADSLTVNVNSLNQTTDGQLLAVSQLTGNGGNWNNDGLIASDGKFDLTLWGNYTGIGRTSSLGDLTLKANQLTLSAASSIAGGGNTTVNINGQLNNQGRLTSSGDLIVTAANLNNYGTIGSGKDLTLTTGVLLNSRGLISSGGDMRLLLSSFTNAYGQVYGLSNVHIGRDRDSSKADLLDNRSGDIYSAKDLTINALTVNNVRDILEYTAHEKSSVVITELDCNLIPIAGCDFRSGSRRNGHWEIAETDRLKVTQSSAAASLTSGGNMTVNAQSLNNTSSTIAATGNITVTAGTINNTGLQEQEIITKRTFWNYVDQIFATVPAAAAFNNKNSPTPSSTVEADLSYFISLLGGGKLTESTTTVAGSGSGSGSSYDAVIQAGGNISLNATQTIDNSVVRPYYSYVAGGKTNTDTGAGNGYSTPVTINAQLPPDLAQQQVNPMDLPGFSLPTGQNGLFRLSQEGNSNPTSTGPQSWTLTGGQVTSGATAAPVTINRVQGLPNSAGKSQPHKYLIETNPVLTDLKQFMSSDYLLSGLGYDPDQSAKRLGDGLFEQKLVQQAVVARTGQRFIDDQTSDEAVFKYLMNNAIASKDELNLSLGVTLTAQQVAALTHDIVWLEEREVNGEKVLVPVLYLANANNRLAPNGALIQGKDVTLVADKDLHNAGTLRASQNLDATAKKDLVSSGLVEAGDRLKLVATNNLTNKAGGIITGRDVTLETKNGNIINERTVTSHDSSVDDYSHARDFVDNAARIEAANKLVINSGRDVINSGGVLKSGGEMDIDAKRDVAIAAVAERHSDSRTDFLNSSITQHGAEVSSGAGLTIDAGRDIAAVASKIDAKGDVTIEAKRDVFFGAAADEEHSYFKDKKETRQEDHVSQIGTSLNAGGKLTFKSGKDMTLVASDISSGQEAYLHADGDLQLLAAQDSDYSLYDMKKKGSFGSMKTQRDEVTDLVHVGTKIKSGGDLTLSSGGDQRYQAASLESANNITLDSGGAIDFEAVKDLHDESHTKSDSNAAWNSAKGKGNTDETLRQSELVANGALVIKAVKGLTIDIKQIDQQNVSQTIDTMVAADPKLAWLKDAELRGDIDWRRVEEIHKSFEYSTSGLGVAAQIALAILLAAVTGGAGAGLIGATAGTFSAGFANAVLIAVETTAANSAISNKGDLGSVLKDVFSAENLQGYVLSGMLGGIGTGLGYNPTELGFDWSSAGTVVLKTGADTLAQTALQGGSLSDNFVNNLLGAVIDIGGALAANGIGNLNLVDGSPTKIAAHALVGGLKSMAMGGDFKTGALAGGANEAMVQYLADLILPENYDPKMPGADQAKANMLAMSQLLAVLTAVVSGTDPNIAANIAATATQYNYLSHSDLERAANELKGCGSDSACINKAYSDYHELSRQQDIDAVALCAADPANCASISKRVAEAEKQTQSLKDMAASASPEAKAIFDLLITENNGFQNMLAGVTTGHTVNALADTLAQTLGISHETALAALDNLATLAAGLNPIVKPVVAGGGKGPTKEGNSGTKGGTNTTDNGTGGSKAPGDTVVRSDNDFSSTVGGNGKPKAYINENGDLVPPNPEGTGTVQTHVRGSGPENSPYISVTDPSTALNPKDYGTHKVEIDVTRLQKDIDSGVLPNTKFLTSQQVAAELQSKLDAARVRFENNPSKRNEDSLKGAERDLGNAMRDGECLIKGCVPSTYITPVKK
ncbi:two-partner secretion domain-containing protein [Pseudomonas sp. LB1P83]